MIQRALNTAVQYHNGQFRKDGYTPYIVHPIEVMRKVWKWGITNPTILSAALLHDTLEDTSLTQQELRDDFGNDVYILVNELSQGGVKPIVVLKL